MGDLHSETNLLPNFQSYFNSLRVVLNVFLDVYLMKRLEKGNRMRVLLNALSLKTFLVLAFCQNFSRLWGFFSFFFFLFYYGKSCSVKLTAVLLLNFLIITLIFQEVKLNDET